MPHRRPYHLERISHSPARQRVIARKKRNRADGLPLIRSDGTLRSLTGVIETRGSRRIRNQRRRAGLNALREIFSRETVIQVGKDGQKMMPWWHKFFPTKIMTDRPIVEKKHTMRGRAGAE